MRRIILIAWILYTVSALSAQEITARMILADSLDDCSEIQYASMQLIPLYYQDGLFDSASMILNYWEKHCGRDETIYRTKMLWAIDSGTFTDSLPGEELIGYLDEYQWFASDTSGNSLELYYYYMPEFELLRWYKSFTDTIARRAIHYPDLSPTERFLLNFYIHPHDSTYRILEDDTYKGSRISTLYNQPADGEIQKLSVHYGFSGGIWIPDDKLATLGVHPSIGGFAGFGTRKMNYNLGLAFRVGKSPNEIKTVYLNSVYSTDEFTGINISLETARHILDWRRHQFDILSGLSLELIDVLTITSTNDDGEEVVDTRTLKSPSLHLGACYRYYTNKNHYLSVSGKYHFLDIRNKGGTNLRGNALSFTIECGFGRNRWLNSRNTFLKERLPARY
jgi:hypothetical protein